MQVAQASLPAPVLTTIVGKGKNKKKQKGRYNIVKIDILLKRLEINNVIMIFFFERE